MHRPVPSFPLKHVALGLTLRELLAPWTGHPYDFEIWTRLGFYMQNLGNPYQPLPYVPSLSFVPSSSVGSISYPPLSAFIFALFYRLYLALGEPSRFLYYFLLKQPMVLADVGVALVLAKIILLSGNLGLARRAFLVWLYFPFGIIISSIWGQLDPFALFLTLLAIYYFYESKWLPSSAMLGLSIYLKTLPVVFLPVFLMQDRIKGKSKIGYSLVTLSIPIIGTLLPALVFNWGYQEMYNNFFFQAAIPWSGTLHTEMSVPGLVNTIPSVPLFIRYLAGPLWIPVLLLAFTYSYRKRLPLIRGLLIVILAFSISRPFLPEQWSLYPLAFLLLVKKSDEIGPFIGLAVASTASLLANNDLMVRFLSPISINTLYWDLFFNNQSLRVTIVGLLASLYLVESLLVLLRRESIVHRTIVWVTPDWLLRRARVSATGANLA